MDINDQKKKWGEKVGVAYLKWPDENIIRFMNRTFNQYDKTSIKVLDLGCGAGRNTVALVYEGFQMYGVDYSKECVEITKERCKKIKNSKVVIKQNSNTDIPIENNILDAVVACGSLFFSNLQDRKLLIKSINRVLKKDGVFWANWRTTEDYMYKKGERIEKNFYFLYTSGREGLAYYFATIEELKELYNDAGFEIYNIEKFEMNTNNLKEKSSWWHISAKKL
ncbi:class I SAM-dependent methyltransferase [Clostridium uliginosum]|uniref:Ubiquinone/menaquinone biosynthesis C-methylase UbiE n=1 Tax=Clostridium uliginosum TaxID=119641 RepID=A0A1I1RJA3_9CLOT|nr:class I SAM-dependent methyltransferase [Clostridium uliginosum]SFD34232.1 Ubiquinone/menaquinone biosynthesis C-methylase UbiE [Clostridium uliginosum]